MDQEAAHGQGDEDVVEQPGIVDYGPLTWGWLIVLKPGIREVGGGLGMALLASGNQVGLYHVRLRIVRGLNVMDPVAVGTDSLARPDRAPFFLVEVDGDAVEVLQVGLLDHTGDAVPGHDGLVIVAV